MARVHDKVNATQFTVETGLNDEQIRVAGHRGIEAAKRFMGSGIQEDQFGPGRIDYSVKGPGKVMRLMRFTVTWHGTGDRRTVQMKIIDFTTTQSTVMFIPVSPKSAPALTSVQRFAEVFKRELTLG